MTSSAGGARGVLLVALICLSTVTGCGRFGFSYSAGLGAGDGGPDAAVDGGPDGGVDAGPIDGGPRGDGSVVGPEDAGPLPDASFEADGGLVDCSEGQCRRVFVTADAPPNANLGGLAGGDDFCQSAADAEGLGGTWKAWLSDASASPSTRFTHAAVPYVLLDGSVVASDWADLTDGALFRPIDRTERNAPAQGITEVWTGTYFDGTASASTCSDWTSGEVNSPYAVVGHWTATSYPWTEVYLQFCNRTDVHLYCFEQ